MQSLQSFFPVCLTTEWQNVVPVNLAPSLVDWLLHPGSLTARLQAHSADFRVLVLGQQVQSCSAAEACSAIQAGEQVLVREVLLYCDNQPQVFARSLLPLTSLTGEQSHLASLGEQPLGAVIFNNPSLQRQFIEVAKFPAASSISAFAKQLKVPKQDEIWGRRSLFLLEGKPFSVAEVFLPGSYAYQSEK